MDALAFAVLWLAIIAITVWVWYLPIYFASDRGHPSYSSIRTLTFLSLLCPVLWIVAIVWSLTGENLMEKKRAEVAAARERLTEREMRRLYGQSEIKTARLDAELEQTAREAEPVFERCENCGRAIGKLETPELWQEHVVCHECKTRLAHAQA